MGQPHQKTGKRSPDPRSPIRPSRLSGNRSRGKQLSRWLSASTIAVMMAVSTVITAAALPQQSLTQQPSNQQFEQPASLQISQRRIRRKDIWQEVQRQLPDLPLENQYVSKESGDINDSNTLLRRMIEYHNFRKGRSPRSRFDWKLTLADYLGLNEAMPAETYPGNRTLRTSPLNGDRAAVRGLNRQQRQQLVNTLVSLYDPRIPAAFFSPQPLSEPPVAAPEPASPEVINANPIRPNPPPLSEPGAADLLRPRN